MKARHFSRATQLTIKLYQIYLKCASLRSALRSAQDAPFKFTGTVDEAYGNMNTFFTRLAEFENNVLKFNEHEELFDLQISKFTETGETRNELRHLKNVWDFKDMTQRVFENWKTFMWSEVNTDDLEDENKRLLKQLRGKGADYPTAKQWQTYRDIEDDIKRMQKVLPLVNELHSPAMRQRHWLALARVCNVKSVDPSDPKFTLNDMMELQLDEHEADVSEIVETAQKELKIEKKLTEIEACWADLTLDYVGHKDTEMFVPRPSEDVVEGIEAHQMELQGIFGMGKFMEYFKVRQKKSKTAPYLTLP